MLPPPPPWGGGGSACEPPKRAPVPNTQRPHPVTNFSNAILSFFLLPYEIIRVMKLYTVVQKCVHIFLFIFYYNLARRWGVLMEIFVSGCSYRCSEVIFANNHVCSSVHMIWSTCVAPSTETMNLLGVMT